MKTLMALIVAIFSMTAITFAESDVTFIVVTKDNVEMLAKKKEYGTLLEGYLIQHHLLKDEGFKSLKDFPEKLTIPVMYDGVRIIPVNHERLMKLMDSKDPQGEFGINSFIVDLVRDALAAGYDIEIDIGGDVLISNLAGGGNARLDSEDGRSSLTQQLLNIQSTLEQEVKNLQGDLGTLKKSFEEMRKKILQIEKEYATGTVEHGALLKFHKETLKAFETVIQIVRPKLYTKDSFNGNSGVLVVGDNNQVIYLSVAFGNNGTPGHGPMLDCGWGPVESMATFSPAH